MLPALLACLPALEDTAPPTGPLPTDSTTAAGGDCFDTAPFLHIGTGESAFEPLEEGDPVTMVHGPQGGWHVPGGVEVHHTNVVVTIDFLIHDEASGVTVCDASYSLNLLREDDTCIGRVHNLYGYLDVSGVDGADHSTPVYEVLGGNTLLMEMTVTDSSGRIAYGTLPVTAALDPKDEAEDTGGE